MDFFLLVDLLSLLYLRGIDYDCHLHYYSDPGHHPRNHLCIDEVIKKVKPLRWIANTYIEVLRGTPMLVQILIAFGLLQGAVLTCRRFRLVC